MDIIGVSVPRIDAIDKVTGRAAYVGDLEVSGMLHGKIVRSPHAHARIASIDTTAAEAMPGVKAVITGSDFPDLAANGAHPSAIDVANNAIARDKVLYEGHVVAAVAAITREQGGFSGDPAGTWWNRARSSQYPCSHSSL